MKNKRPIFTDWQEVNQERQARLERAAEIEQQLRQQRAEQIMNELGLASWTQPKQYTRSKSDNTARFKRVLRHCSSPPRLVK